jgi:hypothetical protein
MAAGLRRFGTRLGAATMLVAIVFAGGASCQLGNHVNPGFNVDNRRAEAVTIRIVDLADLPSNERLREVTVPARSYQQLIGPNQCHGSGAVATDPSGTELARLDEPVCFGHEWVFEEDGSVRLRNLPTR